MLDEAEKNKDRLNELEDVVRRSLKLYIETVAEVGGKNFQLLELCRHEVELINSFDIMNDRLNYRRNMECK